MPLTNFPNGLTSMGVPTFGPGGGSGTYNGVPSGAYGVPLSNGNYWFVDSANGSDGFAGTAQSPLATLTRALALATANNGDVIVLCPNHAETVSAAAGINVNVAGVSIVGLGNGRNRPVYTFGTTTAATITLTAANVTLANIVATTTIDQIVSPFVVSAADVNLAIEWQDKDATHEALRAILTTNAADRLRVNLLYNGFTAGSHGVNAVRLVGGTGAQINVNYYGVLTTAVVEFVTTAVKDAQVTGFMYVSGSTNQSKLVVDTITGSTWSLSAFDGAAAAAVDGGSGKAVGPSDPSSLLTVPTANAATNVYERDVIGNKTDTAVYFPTTTASNAAYTKGASDLQEQTVTTTTAATMVNGNTIFTITGASGWIEIIALGSYCVTANGATATTLQYSSTQTLGTLTQTLSGASATLANAVVGTTVVAQLTALSTAPVVNANGAGLGGTGNGIVVGAGTITMVVGVGSTTGTWNHFIRYRPLTKGMSVTAAF